MTIERHNLEGIIKEVNPWDFQVINTNASSKLDNLNNTLIGSSYTKANTSVVGSGKDGWIQHGENDNVPSQKQELNRISGIHNSCIELKHQMASGNGLDFKFKDHYTTINEAGLIELHSLKLTEKEKEEDILKARSLMLNIKADNYLKKAAEQYMIHGDVYFYEKWQRNIYGKMHCKGLKAEKSTAFRLGSERVSDGVDFRSKYIYLSNNWNATQTVVPYSKFVEKSAFGSQMTKLPTFSVDLLDGKTNLFLSHLKRDRDYRDFYGTADYETEDVLKYILIDYMISIDDHKGLADGFPLAFIIVRYRKKKVDPKKEKQAKVEDLSMLRNHKGVDGDRSLVMWADPLQTKDGVETPKILDIIPLPTDSTERHTLLRGERLSKILSGHQIMTPELIGMASLRAGGLANQGDQITLAQKHLQSNSIDAAQKILLEPLSRIMALSGIKCYPSILPSTANYLQPTPDELKEIASGNERRNRYGLPSITKEEEAAIKKMLFDE